MNHDSLQNVNLLATPDVIFNPLAKFFGNQPFTLISRGFPVRMLHHPTSVHYNHAPLNLSNLHLSGYRLDFRDLHSQLTERPISDSHRSEDKQFLLGLKLVLFVGPHSHLSVLIRKEPERDHHVELLVGHLSHLG